MAKENTAHWRLDRRISLAVLLQLMVLVSLILAVWVAWCVRAIFQPGKVTIARTVYGLLAGIVFVDWLAVAPQIPHPLSAVVFLALFGAIQLLRRFVPAT